MRGGRLHFVDLLDRMESSSHAFLPPLAWDPVSVGSCLFLAETLCALGKTSFVIGHPQWLHHLPAQWTSDRIIFPTESRLHLEQRPDWVWLWGIRHETDHADNLSDFLLGCQSIQVLDWTHEKSKRTGDAFHKTPLLGGLSELSWILAREIHPARMVPAPSLASALLRFINLYPFTLRDAPLNHLLGRIARYHKTPSRATAPTHIKTLNDTWEVRYFENLAPLEHHTLLDHGLEVALGSPQKNCLLVFEHIPGHAYIRTITTSSAFEWHVRHLCRTQLSSNPDGSFKCAHLDHLLELLPRGDLSQTQELHLHPWPSAQNTAPSFQLSCSDEVWQVEHQNRLDALAAIPEQEEPGEAFGKKDFLTWDANQLLERLKTLDRDQRERLLRMREEAANTFFTDPVISWAPEVSPDLPQGHDDSIPVEDADDESLPAEEPSLPDYNLSGDIPSFDENTVHAVAPEAAAWPGERAEDAPASPPPDELFGPEVETSLPPPNPQDDIFGSPESVTDEAIFSEAGTEADGAMFANAELEDSAAQPFDHFREIESRDIYPDYLYATPENAASPFDFDSDFATPSPDNSAVEDAAEPVDHVITENPKPFRPPAPETPVSVTVDRQDTSTPPQSVEIRRPAPGTGDPVATSEAAPEVLPSKNEPALPAQTQTVPVATVAKPVMPDSPEVESSGPSKLEIVWFTLLIGTLLILWFFDKMHT